MSALWLLLVLPLGAALGAEWWERPWRQRWVDVTLQGATYPVLTRRVGNGARKLFCVQGGPGGLFWDLNFLAVYLDLSEFEVIQYDPLGSAPSACADEGAEPCGRDGSWMTVEGFVSTMDQVHRALAVPAGAVIVAHSFGVVCALEFLLRWPRRAAGAVLSDWVPSQAQAARRNAWCNESGWTRCRMYNESLEEPWSEMGLTNPLLGKTIWGPGGDGAGGVLQHWDVRPRLRALRGVPTLSFAGDLDIVFPRDVEEMSEELAGEYVFLPGAGHFSFVDRREAWLDAFRGWARRLPRGGCAAAEGPAEELPPDLRGSTGAPVPRWLAGRRYFLSVPSTYTRARPHSLVLSFHGMMGQPQDAPFFGTALPQARDVIFAFPEGADDVVDDFLAGGARVRSWNGSGSVGSPGPAGPTCEAARVRAHCAESCVALGGCADSCWLTTCVDDAGFVAALLDELESEFCIDPGSVHAVGFSSGGWFVLELGTDPRVAGRFQSLVALAGLPFRGFNRPPALRRGARFVGVYGRGDHLVPGFPNSPEDPTEAIASSGYRFSTWPNTSRLWAATLGCGLLRNASALRPEGGALQCLDYACPEGAVSVCLWDGPHAVAPGALSVAWQTFFPDAPRSAPPVPSLREAGGSFAAGMSADHAARRAVLLALALVLALALWLRVAPRRFQPSAAAPLLVQGA